MATQINETSHIQVPMHHRTCTSTEPILKFYSILLYSHVVNLKKCFNMAILSWYSCTAICPDLTLTNGVISFSPDTTPRLEGTVATHSCDVGHGLSGGTERTCQSNRTWSEGNIICKGIGIAMLRNCNSLIK